MPLVLSSQHVGGPPTLHHFDDFAQSEQMLYSIPAQKEPDVTCYSVAIPLAKREVIVDVHVVHRLDPHSVHFVNFTSFAFARSAVTNA